MESPDTDSSIYDDHQYVMILIRKGEDPLVHDFRARSGEKLENPPPPDSFHIGSKESPFEFSPEVLLDF